MFENVGFKNEFGKLRLNKFRPGHGPNFKELGFKLGPSFLRKLTSVCQL